MAFFIVLCVCLAFGLLTFDATLHFADFLDGCVLGMLVLIPSLVVLSVALSYEWTKLVFKRRNDSIPRTKKEGPIGQFGNLCWSLFLRCVLVVSLVELTHFVIVWCDMDLNYNRVPIWHHLPGVIASGVIILWADWGTLSRIYGSVMGFTGAGEVARKKEVLAGGQHHLLSDRSTGKYFPLRASLIVILSTLLFFGSILFDLESHDAYSSVLNKPWYLSVLIPLLAVLCIRFAIFWTKYLFDGKRAAKVPTNAKEPYDPFQSPFREEFFILVRPFWEVFLRAMLAYCSGFHFLAFYSLSPTIAILSA